MNNNKLKNIISNTKSAVLQAWYYILDKSPTDTWQQPALTFITNVLNKSTGTLSDDELDQCALFLCNLARAIYGKGLDNDLLRGRTIEQEMEYAQTVALQNKIYKPKIKVTKHFDIPKRFEQKINGDIPKELQWGLCAIIACTYGFDKIVEQETKLKKPILKTAVVEQLFPNKWDLDFPNEVNEWTIEKIKKSLQTIGNLTLIEPAIHKTTNKIYKGNFFAKRKNPDTGKGYKDSVFEKFHILCDMPDNMEWFYGLWENSQNDGVKRLGWFFSGLSQNAIIL
jgi:hypothetical protein